MCGDDLILLGAPLCQLVSVALFKQAALVHGEWGVGVGSTQLSVYYDNTKTGVLPRVTFSLLSKKTTTSPRFSLLPACLSLSSVSSGTNPDPRPAGLVNTRVLCAVY